MKLKKYVSGRISVCFVVETGEADNLLDNQFDTLVLHNSITGVIVPIEIMTLDMDEIVKLGDDEDTDERLA